MRIEYLTYREQCRIAKDLYNMTNSLKAAKKLQNEYGIKIKSGRSVKLRSFARKLDKTKFSNSNIEKTIFKHSKHKVDLSDFRSSWF